ncbi:hypothetical protein EDD86DRAFT_220618 [Gorgonomyces haynaldii]|nr:hypothetical protein EDD86DRAFT_220618 [Gorgonomyces haynaldii]
MSQEAQDGSEDVFSSENIPAIILTIDDTPSQSRLDSIGGSVRASMRSSIKKRAQFEDNSDDKLQVPAPDMPRAASVTSSLDAQTLQAKEITETIVTRLLRMKWTLLGIFFNALSLAYITQNSDEHEFYVDQSVLTHLGAVLVELALLIANIVTLMGMDDAIAALFGYLMSRRHGYSMVTVGFCQTTGFAKPRFVSQLSHNSPSKKLLTYLALPFFLIETLKLLTPISATAVDSHPMLKTLGEKDCTIFNQDGEQFDRGFPDMDVEFGVGDLVFAKALGQLRVVDIKLPYSHAFVGAQPMVAIHNGESLIGNGLSVKIRSSCSCIADSNLYKAFANRTMQEAATITNFTRTLDQATKLNGMVFDFKMLDSNTLDSYQIITGADTCGGTTEHIYPVCHTVMWDHAFAAVEYSYATDGATKSLSQVEAVYRGVLGPANMTWLYNGMRMLISDSPMVKLPSIVPGIINPLLSFATRENRAIDFSILPQGIEGMMALLVRGAVKRSYTNIGSKCQLDSTAANYSVLTMKNYGYYTAVVILALQLLCGILCLVCFLPLWTSEFPFGPAIRVMQEPCYFYNLLGPSSLQANMHAPSNAEVTTLIVDLSHMASLGLQSSHWRRYQHAGESKWQNFNGCQ